MSKISIDTITNRDGSHGPVISGVTTITGNLKVGSTGAVSLDTGTDTTPLIRTSSGLIGIGTLVPTNTLHVNSATGDVVANFQSTDTKSVIRLTDTGGSSDIGAEGNSIKFYPGGTERVTIDSAGNIIAAGVVTSTGGLSIGAGSTAAPSVSPSGDTDTGMFFPAANTIAFSKGGAEALRIDSSGRVGIGTENPGSGTDGESDDLVIHRASGAAGMTIKTANNVTGAIRFADTDGASQGRIEYNHPSDYLRWNTGGSEKLRIDSSGNLILAADTNTYIGHPASDTLALTTGGTERLRVTSTGYVGVGNNDPDVELHVHSTSQNPAVEITRGAVGSEYGYALYGSDGATTPALRFFTISNGAGTGEKARFDSSGRFLVSATTSSGAGANIQSVGTHPLELHRGVNSTGGPNVSLSKSRNTTYGSNTIVQSGDTLGTIQFRGDDGTDYVSAAAYIQGQVDGTPGANDMPGRLVFSTTADGSATPTEQLRIRSASGDTEVRITGYGGNSNNDTNSELTFNNSTYGITAKIRHLTGIGGVQSGKGQLAFFVDNGATLAERLRINEDGLVGIGTDVPNTILDVRGSGPIAKVVANDQSNARMRIQAGNSSSSYLEFGDSDDDDVGEIVYDHSNNSMRFRTAGTPHVYLDSSGRLLIGPSSSEAFGGIAAPLQIEGNSNATTRMSIYRASNDTGAPCLTLAKSRGTDHTVVNSGDELGNILFYGSDGTDTNNLGAIIRAVVDGTPGTNDMPGRLVFMTSADGSSSPTERLRIANNGAWGLGGATYGSSGQVLTSNGSGSAPTWQDGAESAFAKYVTFNSSGTISNQSGVSSVSRASDGRFTVNFNGNMGNSTYYVSMCSGQTSGFNDGAIAWIGVTKSTSAIEYYSSANNNGGRSFDLNQLVIFTIP